MKLNVGKQKRKTYKNEFLHHESSLFDLKIYHNSLRCNFKFKDMLWSQQQLKGKITIRWDRKYLYTPLHDHSFKKMKEI